MRRKLFTLTAAISLMLCVATACLWMHSAFRAAWWQHVGARDTRGFVKQWTVSSANGRICWWRLQLGPAARPTPLGHSGGVQPASRRPWPWLAASTKDGWGVLGFYREHVRYSAGPQDSRLIAVPYWLVFVLFALTPIQWWRTRLAARQGFCRVCGYDMRATPGRCPECGAVPQATPTTAA